LTLERYIHAKVPSNYIDAIDKIEEITGKSRSEIIREAIQVYIYFFNHTYKDWKPERIKSIS
jgi:metal-responsive CopG/Arc/MetJ family transcriptional regulator